MGIAGVIFDCDGVLVDSEHLAAQVLSDYLADLGLRLTPSEVDKLYRGRSLNDVEADVARRLVGSLPADSARVGSDRVDSVRAHSIPADFQQAVALRTQQAFANNLKPIEGVAELIRTLQERGVRLAVASSGTPEKIRSSLEHTGLLHFFGNALFSASQVKQGKPAPDLFLLAAKELGIPASQCAVVEDSPAGATGAVAAKMLTVGYCESTNPAELSAIGAITARKMSEVAALLLPRLSAQASAHFNPTTEALSSSRSSR